MKTLQITKIQCDYCGVGDVVQFNPAGTVFRCSTCRCSVTKMSLEHRLALGAGEALAVIDRRAVSVWER